MAFEIPFDTRQLLIGGVWRACASGATLMLDNPSDGSPLAAIARGTAADIDAAVAAAEAALAGEWGRCTAAERGRLLCAIGRKVLEQADLLAHLEALDVGKPLKQGRADAVALARYLEFYGGAADKVHGETLPFQAGFTALTLREPHGVTGHIVPWNYPMQIVGRSCGAALAMGNACVLKPAEEACLTVLAFARIAAECGLPAGALNVVPGLGEEAGAALSAHAGIRHISFTGSGATGTLVQRAAATNAVPVTLELGGKSPQIVFADADLDAALPSLVNAGIQNAGQTCSAASRILVERAVFDAVRDRMAERYRLLRVGPAMKDLDIGPVQVLIAVEGEGEALRIANGTAFGLVAGVWTRDGGRQMRMAHALKCGQVFIDNYGAGGGVELPFGGVKLSGHGREKGFEARYGDCSAPADQFHTIKLYAADRECIEPGTSPIRPPPFDQGGSCDAGPALAPRHATPRHATPRHATPRRAAPRRAAPSASVTAAMTKGSTCSRVCRAATRSACLRCRPPNGHRSTGRCQPGPHARARRGRVRCPGSPRSARARGRHRSAIARGLRSGCR